MSKLRKCCVVSCNANSETHRLFKFPKNDKLRELWLSFLVPINVQLSGLTKGQLLNKYVCHMHFDRHQFDGVGNRLAHGYPCLFTSKEILHGIPLSSVNECNWNDHNYCKLPTVLDSTDPANTTTINGPEFRLHKFPNPSKEPERFRTWLWAIKGDLTSLENDVIYRKRRICQYHFLPQYISCKMLTSTAVPTLHLTGILGKKSQERTSVLPLTEPGSRDNDDPPTVSSPEDIGRSNLDTPAIIELPREHAKESVSAETVSEGDKRKLTVSMPNITNGTSAETPRPAKQVLQLRLIDDDGFCDEPVYEVLTDDETDKEVNTKQTATQTAVQNLHVTNSPSEENDLQFAPTVTPERTEPTYYDKYKNKEYWKLKLKHILHNTQFCGVCLEADVDMNTLTDEVEITDDEKSYRRSLRDIVEKVFREGGCCPANSQICNNCTKKLIQSYIFIYNAEETSKMLDRHLDELYSKTCYVRNNSLKDASNAHSRIYNVIIALDNKVISENYESSQIKIEPPEKPDSHQNQNERIRDKRKRRCVSCNVVLPSYRAWKIHERTAHKQSHRCRICLQSYKTQLALTAHYKTHLKSRCALCHRTVQDGELLQHLKTRHKRSIHLCTTCNVVFYSAKALESHKKECHRGEDAKCVTCLQSLSQVELERHQCRFKCPECEEVPCVHHRYLMWYREQMANLAPRAKCAECRYVCTSKEALVVHVNRQHLSLQPHLCASCGQEFYCESDLNKHICTFERGNEDLHICQYCDKTFSSLYICKRHKKRCEGIQRKYQCEDCPANFDTSKDHMKHRKLKHGKEVLSCRLCDRVFLNDLKRTRHERQVHGEQRGRANFVCVECQTKFSSKAALELHVRYHGPEANCQLDTLRQFKSHKPRHRRSWTVCEVCGVVISRILFKKHMITHSMATVSCKTCGKSFQNSTLLRYHQSVHVKIVPCPRCKKLISSAKLWRHFRNHLIRDSLDFQVAAIHGL